MRPGSTSDIDGFKNVGFSLCVVSVENIDSIIQLKLKKGIITEILQF